MTSVVGYCGVAAIYISEKKEKILESQFTPDVIPPNAVGPVEIVKVAAAEQVAPKPVRRWRVRVFQIYLVAATVAFGSLVVLASAFDYFAVDLSITRSVQTIHAAWFASFMEWVSFLGYTPQVDVLVVAVAVLLFFIGLRWEAVYQNDGYRWEGSRDEL